MAKKGSLATLAVLGLGVLAFWYFTRKTSAAKRSDLLNWLSTQPGDNAAATAVFGQMTDPEIDSVYDFVFGYYLKNIKPAPGSDLYNQINAIRAKYNIFT
jgi:hypothetical protein